MATYKQSNPPAEKERSLELSDNLTVVVTQVK